MNRVADFVQLMRPHQWIKNVFVFTGFIFIHAWDDFALLQRVVMSAAGFCLMSSGIYILNDIVDREQDRRHPRKKNRPLAAGRVSVSAAGALGVFLTMASLGLAFRVSQATFLMLLAYGLMNVLYSFHLKHRVLLDVFVIAAGFMLRILVGTLGVGIPPSQWLVLCGIMITLFLGFSKRRAEIITMGEGESNHRSVLKHYSPVFLDQMIGITATGAIMSYSLYTMSPDTIRIHGTENLIYTVPIVIYGVFRYIYLLHHRHGGTDTAHDIVRDPWLVLTLVAWFGATLWLIT